jgi:hypothetical protein
MGHAPLLCPQDGNDRSEEDGNNMIALIVDIIVPTSIRWWSQFFFLSKKMSWHFKKKET